MRETDATVDGVLHRVSAELLGLPIDGKRTKADVLTFHVRRVIYATQGLEMAVARPSSGFNRASTELGVSPLLGSSVIEYRRGGRETSLSARPRSTGTTYWAVLRRR